MISILTVNYRTKAETGRMLRSFFAHVTCEVEVIVVENGSGDDLSDLAREFPQVKFITSEVNRGFAGGCHLAAKHATGELLILVNPDVIFTSDAACQLAEQMRAEPAVAVGGISLKNIDGTQQDCVWGFPEPLDQLLLLLKVPHVFPDLGPIRRWLAKDFDYTKTQDCDQVMGAFFAIRRDAWEQLGGLDRRFFMWYEEVDFCRRAVDAGWRVRYFAEISATHEGGRSFTSIGTWKKQAMVRKSIRRYMRKHWGLNAYLIFVMLEPVFLVTAFVASLIKPR